MNDLEQAAREGGLDNIRGLAAQITELDTVYGVQGGPYQGLIVCVVKHHGCHVCWGCMEMFGAPFTPEGPHEVVPPGGTVPILLHRKCINPKNRKAFSDMKEPRRLQTAEEVTRGFRVRRALAMAVKPFLGVATDAVNKVLITGE